MIARVYKLQTGRLSLVHLRSEIIDRIDRGQWDAELFQLIRQFVGLAPDPDLEREINNARIASMNQKGVQ